MSLGMRRAIAFLLPFLFGEANPGKSLKFQHRALLRVCTHAQHRESSYKIDIACSADSCGISAICAVRQIVQFRRAGRNYM
jgi:hypothetical protein